MGNPGESDRRSRWRKSAAALSTTVLLAGCELPGRTTPENALDPFGVVVRYSLEQSFVHDKGEIDWTLFTIGVVPVGKNPFTDAPSSSLTEANKRTHAAILGASGKETARTTFEAKCFQAALLTNATEFPTGVLMRLPFELPQVFTQAGYPARREADYLLAMTDIVPTAYRLGVQAQKAAQERAARGDRTGAEGWKAENTGDAADAFDIGSGLCRDDSVTGPLEGRLSLGDIAAMSPINRNSIVYKLCAERCASDSWVPLGPDFVPYADGLSEKGWALYQKLLGASSSTGPSESPAALRRTALGVVDRRGREPRQARLRVPRPIYPTSGK